MIKIIKTNLILEYGVQIVSVRKFLFFLPSFLRKIYAYIYPYTYYYVFDAFKENDERGLNKTYKNCERKRPLRYFKEQEYCITMVNRFKICWILTIAGSISD